MPLAIWSSNLVTGNDVIDTQHKKLFEIINELHKGIISGQGKHVVAKTMDDLVSYTREHFRDEEKYMVTTGYFDIAAHKLKHVSLVKELDVMAKRYGAGEQNMPSVMSKFLANWLSEHIKATDILMVESCKVRE